MSVQRIVVGYDGSMDAELALAWAVKLVHRTGASLTVVAAWDSPVVLGAPVSLTGSNPDSQLRDRIRSALRTNDVDPEMVDIVVRHGHPGRVLVDASREADLLVVGRRGSNLERLLRSVSNHCVTAATCSVCVVPSQSVAARIG